MKVYIAAPLFNESELERNRGMRDFVRGLGFETYLPQEDGGIAFDLIKSGARLQETRKRIFENDMEQVKTCDIFLCILDGRVPDEGLCIELGYAYALGKTCVGYLTDKRSLDEYGINLMIEGCLPDIAHSREELHDILTKL
ncbi:MAG TPA: nucleoside 2-deoxyribosyltransferase [Candidatus Paceibacterota bacterium]|nr:nucleoside 2-deoxyribosyltransferase [Candidatus Paceibacterota bacterium]